MTLPSWMKQAKDGSLKLLPDSAPPVLLKELNSLGIAADSYQVQLPDWATMREDGVVVDPALAYPKLLAELEQAGIKSVDEQLDKYWAEVVYQIMKLELQLVMQRYGFAIKILRNPEWALKTLPTGRGIIEATKGGMARSYFKRLRGL